MPSLVRDLQYAVRQLRKTPGMAFLAIFTLALGVGANTGIFTVIESVLLRPLPYPNSDRLVYIGNASDEPSFSATSWMNFQDIKAQSKLLQSVGGYSEDVSVLQTKSSSQSVAVPHVTPSLFSILGARPLLGRTFTESEGQAGGALVALLSEGLWRETFRADQAVVGQSVSLAGKPYTVVGVMPASFRFPEQIGPDLQKGLWVPMQPTPTMLDDRGYNLFEVIGELRPGATLSQAQQEVDAIAAHIPRKKDEPAIKLQASSYHELLTGPVRPVLLALFGALALVLLIACANVSNLLIARCLGRQQEFAVRTVLGAGRFRLVRQLLAEGLALSFAGCGVGLLLAQLAIVGVHKLPPGTIARGDLIDIHWTVVLVLAAVAIVTTVLSSLLPALIVSRSNPQAALQSASRGVGARSVGGKLTAGLVAGEVAFSTLLLVGTGLLFHTLWNLQKSRLGFETEHITTFTAMPPDAAGFSGLAVSQDTGHAPASIATLTYKPVLEQIRHVPGVESAALATAPPLSSMDLSSDFEIIGEPKDPANPPDARVSAVSGDYARVFGTPLVSGRNINDDDTGSSPFVAVINQTLEHKYFAGKDPLGKQINPGGKGTGMIKPYTIIGVLSDQVDKTVGGTIQPFILIPQEQVPTTSLFYQAPTEDRGQFRGEDPGKCSSCSRDAIGVSPGSAGDCAGQFQNHARSGRAEHLQPAPGTVPGGLVCGPGGTDGHRRVIRSVVAVGGLPAPGNRCPHGARSKPAERGTNGAAAGIGSDRSGTGCRDCPGISGGAVDQELSLPGPGIRRLDLRSSRGRATRSGINCSVPAGPQSGIDSAHASIAGRLTIRNRRT
jgi:putative ABC transport system permease protein